MKTVEGLPQEGEPLKVKAGLKTVAERLADANKQIKNSPGLFQRLVGFVSLNGEDNPVTFYKLTRATATSPCWS